MRTRVWYMYMYVCFRTTACLWKSGDELHLILRQILFCLLLHMSGQLALKLLGHLLSLLPSCLMNADITDMYHRISCLCANSFTHWAISLASFIKCQLNHMTLRPASVFNTRCFKGLQIWPELSKYFESYMLVTENPAKDKSCLC